MSIKYSKPPFSYVTEREGISLDETVLVDTSQYGILGMHWCKVILIKDGDASIYPFVIKMPKYGRGQFSREQIKSASECYPITYICQEWETVKEFRVSLEQYQHHIEVHGWSHTERIVCPECQSIEEAEVKHSFPSELLYHVCEKCKCEITDTEWDLYQSL